MKRATCSRALRALVAVATGAAATVVGAQALDITRHVIAGGGGVSSAGNFSVAGSIGQSLAVAPARGGSFEVQGGFWSGAAALATDSIFEDGFEPP